MFKSKSLDLEKLFVILSNKLDHGKDLIFYSVSKADLYLEIKCF